MIGFRLDDYPDFLTAAEAQKVLRISRNHVYYLIAEGTIPSIKLGKRVLVPKAGLQSVVNGWQEGKNGVIQ